VPTLPPFVEKASDFRNGDVALNQDVADSREIKTFTSCPLCFPAFLYPEDIDTHPPQVPLSVVSFLNISFYRS
jgi:hypothetical protein